MQSAKFLANFAQHFNLTEPSWGAYSCIGMLLFVNKLPSAKVSSYQCRDPDGSIEDILSDTSLNARTRAHEYGGGEYGVGNYAIYFSNFK